MSTTRQAANRWVRITFSRIFEVEREVIPRVRLCPTCRTCTDPDHIRERTELALAELQRFWDRIRQEVARDRRRAEDVSEGVGAPSG